MRPSAPRRLATSANRAWCVCSKREGRLKLCSGSVLFDPKDFRYPILKFPFDSVAGCGKWNGKHVSRASPASMSLMDRRSSFV